MKKYLLIAVFIVASISDAHADITIGFSAPMTGSNAYAGEQLLLGAQQAVKDINAKGGVNGQAITLSLGDDACDPKQAVTVANNFVSKGIKFVAGYYCSGVAIPASKVFGEEGVLLVASVTSNPKVTDEATSDLVFRVYGRDDKSGAVIGNYIAENFPKKRVAIINDQTTYGLGIAQEVQKTINAHGMKEIAFESYTDGERDFSTLISKLRKAHTDILFIGGYQTEAALITRQLKEFSPDIEIIGCDAISSDDFWSVTGAAGENVKFVYVSDPRNRHDAQQAVEAMRQNGHGPASFSLYAYASIQTIAEGIRRAGPRDVESVAKSLRQNPVKTIVGTLNFDSKGDLTTVPFVMYKWHNGSYSQITK